MHAQPLKWRRRGKADVVCTEQGKMELMVLAPGVAVTTEMLASHRTLAEGKVSDGSLVVTDVWKKCRRVA